MLPIIDILLSAVANLNKCFFNSINSFLVICSTLLISTQSLLSDFLLKSKLFEVKAPVLVTNTIDPLSSIN